MNRVASLLSLVVIAFITCRAAPQAAPVVSSSAPPATAPASRPSNLTFAVIGDTHFGVIGIDALNRTMIEQINAMPGRPFPPALGGKVGGLRGVLHLGDVTDSGMADQWKQYVALYGLTGKDGLLRFPIHETPGNHDLMWNSPVEANIIKRQGAMPYVLEWDGVRLVNLGMFPNKDRLAVLRADLEKHGKSTPYVLFFHYSIEGPYIEGWTDADKKALGDAIEGYNILAIFHGHFHRAGRYQWRGHEVFLPGSPKHSSHNLLIVRIAEGRLSVAMWNWDKKAWAETFVKNIALAPTTRRTIETGAP